MINYFTQLFSELMDRLLGRSLFGKKAMKSLDFSDLLTREEEQISIPISIHGEPCDDFKSFSSTDDYNRDFLSIFEMYRKDIILDYTNKDGHFRV